MKRRGQKEHSKRGDKQNKFIYYNKTDIDTLKIVVCVCVTNTTKLQKGKWRKRPIKLDYIFKMSTSFCGSKQSVSLGLEKVS